MKIVSSLTELIGNTPLLRAERYARSANAGATILAKLECMNPAGSAKDRIAREMLEEAERTGALQAGGTVIEPTSGNTGIGICAIAAAKGYRAMIVMPDSMSVERQKLMRAYGATLVLTEGAKGMSGAIERAEQLQKEIPGAIIAGQFVNPANAQAHYRTTAQELWQATQGQIDVFVAGVGTGGTITGVGKYLKERNPNIRIIAVEPKNSPVLSGGKAGVHGLQGIGAGFIPAVLDPTVYDEVITVSEEDAYAQARLFARSEGILVGISSGACLWAATELSRRAQFAGKKIVALLPDSGERYLSTALYEE